MPRQNSKLSQDYECPPQDPHPHDPLPHLDPYYHSQKPQQRLRLAQRLVSEEDDEDIMKIDRLQLINASARHELLTANQQLLDFQLNRFVTKNKNQRQKTMRRPGDPASGPVRNTAAAALMSKMHVSEIHEENEQEEAGTTFKR